MSTEIEVNQKLDHILDLLRKVVPLIEKSELIEKEKDSRLLERERLSKTYHKTVKSLTSKRVPNTKVSTPISEKQKRRSSNKVEQSSSSVEERGI